MNPAGMDRPQFVALALELGELAAFQHRRELQSRRLLALLDDAELRALVEELVEEFRAAFR